MLQGHVQDFRKTEDMSSPLHLPLPFENCDSQPKIFYLFSYKFNCTFNVFPNLTKVFSTLIVYVFIILLVFKHNESKKYQNQLIKYPPCKLLLGNVNP